MRDRERIKEYVNETFKDKDKVWVTLSLPNKEKSGCQLGYLHSVIYPALSKCLGCDMVTVDGVMRKKFLTIHEDTRLEYVQSISNFTRGELTEYIDDLIQYGSEIGAEILPPERRE